MNIDTLELNAHLLEYNIFKFKKYIRLSKGDLFTLEKYIITLFNENIKFIPNNNYYLIVCLVESAFVRRTDKILLLYKLGDLNIHLNNRPEFNMVVNSYTQGLYKTINDYINSNDIEMVNALLYVDAINITKLKIETLKVGMLDLLLTRANNKELYSILKQYYSTKLVLFYIIMIKKYIPDKTTKIRTSGSLIYYMVQNVKFHTIISQMINNDNIAYKEIKVIFHNLSNIYLINDMCLYCRKYYMYMKINNIFNVLHFLIRHKNLQQIKVIASIIQKNDIPQFILYLIENEFEQAALFCIQEIQNISGNVEYCNKLVSWAMGNLDNHKIATLRQEILTRLNHS